MDNRGRVDKLPARPVMSDVARHAGVAIGTVSNVLNHPHRVTEKTRLRVLQAIEELGFSGNSVARSLATGRLDAVGFVVVDLANSFFLDIARGVESALDKRGLHLLMANSDVDQTKQDNHIDLFEKTRVAGMILAPLDGPLEVAAKARKGGTPVVHVNWPGNGETCGVVVDEEMGGYLSARHLLGQGCRKLMFAGGPLALTAVRQRLDGARRAVAGFEGARLDLVETTGLTIKVGHELGRQILASGDALPEGVVAASDSLAAGAIQTLIIAGVDVPRLIAFVGYDNNHFAHDNVIPITSVGQPGSEMGVAAVNLLLDELDSPQGHRHETVSMEPRLYERASSRWRTEFKQH